MGNKRIPIRVDGQQMDERWFNIVRAALANDIVPRETAGSTAQDLIASLGPSGYQFLKAFIAEGYWSVGDYKLHHSYNGLVSAGEGWMLCDGRQITQAAYDTEHGAGHWATYVGSSVLLNKYLPDRTNRLPVGASTTPQDGSAPITPTGNASHQTNFQHNHQHYQANGSGADDNFYVSGGGTVVAHGTSSKGSSGLPLAIQTANTTVPYPLANFFTNKAGSATLGIQPECIELQTYMRII